MAKTMIPHSILHYATIIFSIISMSAFFMSEATINNKTIGITIDLIHREYHPQSPYYNSSLTPSQRIANTLERSFISIRRFQATNFSIKTPQSYLISSHGEYLMKFSIGTPPVPALAIADTGSDLLWVQCQRCIQCYKQQLPIFEPRKSSTFRTIPCNSPSCKLNLGFCSKTGNLCLYEQRYHDGATTQGGLVMDTITLDSTDGRRLRYTNFRLGCGVKNTGAFSTESGLVGLGGGRSSLVRQIGRFIQYRFSYCLAPYFVSSTTASKLNFGFNAVVVGGGVVVVPLVRKNPVTFYHVTFEGISIGDSSLRLDVLNNGSKADPNAGNMIVDSGTTLTFLPTIVWNAFQFEVTRRITLPRVKGPASVCYSTQQPIDLEDVTIHFAGGDLKLAPETIFVRISNNKFCLGFDDAKNVEAVLGNLAQTNYLVGFDLGKMTVSFKPKDCTRP